MLLKIDGLRWIAIQIAAWRDMLPITRGGHGIASEL
jgi:hypothetical protein